MPDGPRIDSSLPQPSSFLYLVPFSVTAEMVPIFQVKKLRSLAGTHPRSPGDPEAENLGLMLFTQALLMEDTVLCAAARCRALCGANVSWGRASVDRPSPCPEPGGVIHPPRNADGLQLPPPRRPSAGCYPTVKAVSLSHVDPPHSHVCPREIRPCPASLLWPVMRSGELQASKTLLHECTQDNEWV